MYPFAMRRWKFGPFLLGILLGCAPAFGQNEPPALPAQTPPATQVAPANKWEKSIAAFEAQDKIAPPPTDAALFIGSSSIFFWKDLAKDWPEIPVINRGFGGSYLSDSVLFAPRIAIPYKPRIIVLYAGSNDLEGSKTPQDVTADFKAFVKEIHAALPDTSIVYVSINPSVKRAKSADKVKLTNALIEDYIKTDPKLLFVDSYFPLLGPDGLARPEILRADGLHLNANGYKEWAKIIRPPILQFYAANKSVKHD